MTSTTTSTTTSRRRVVAVAGAAVSVHLVGAWSSAAAQSPVGTAPSAPGLPQRPRAVDLQGHRGARGLAPENTLSAFATALDLGVDTLELDMLVTADDQLVITHDPRLHPDLARDARGRYLADLAPPAAPPGAPPGSAAAPTTPAIRTLTLTQLRDHTVGRPRPGSRYTQQWPQARAVDDERIPTLDELIALLRDRRADGVRLNMEIKHAPGDTPALAPDVNTFAALVVEAVVRLRLQQRTSIQSFNWQALRAVQALAPDLHTVALSARQSWLNNVDDARWRANTGDGTDPVAHGLPRAVRALGAASWSPFHGDATAALVQEAQGLGLKVVPWTVNDPAIMHKLLDWQVDGLITDYPDRARQVWAQRGLPLPRPYPLLK